MNPLITSPTTPGASVKPNLYALVVGIGAYEQIRSLRGPANDAQAVGRYLSQLPDFTPNVLLLTDKQVSKSALIDGFRNHLTQAGPTDTVLFYFAGHGAQEAADPDIWLTETDGQLECLVCHDAGTTNTHEFLLADKELRYLIGPISATGAHVVLIFDCCHSGDNTRSADLLAAAMDGQDVRDRRLMQSAPRRPYDAFCFHDTLSAEQIKAQGLETAMPPGMHVQMAACESDESAVEVNGEGIFTKNLLAVLEAAHGQVTYQDLHNRVRQYMRFSYEQRPRVYIPDMSDLGEKTNSLLNRGFLNQPIDPDTLAASATYNKAEGWLLDVGAIHGVADRNDIQLQDPANQHVYPASIGRVGADYTVLDIADDVRVNLDKSIVYRATIAGLLTQPIRLHFANHGGPNNDLPDLLKPSANPARHGLTDGIIIPEDDETRADYTLHSRNGLYYVTKPGWPDPTDENRPLVLPLCADDPQVFDQLSDDLRHMAKWQYLKQFRNPEVDTPVLSVAVIPQGSDAVQLTNIQSEPLPITYLNNHGQWATTLAIKLTNPTGRPLYCTALYLSRDFMSFTGFMPTNYRLEPGQSMTLGLADKKELTGRRTAFRLPLEEVIRQYNWPSATEYIKLLVTTDPVSEKTLAFLSLDALPSPPVLAGKLKPKAIRGGIETDDVEAEPFPDWSTQTITLQLINPLYNTVRADELSQMLAPPADESYEDMMADFALGLYYEADTTSGLQPTLKLRDELRVIAPDDQRGLWSDLKLSVANQVARRVQNRQYRQNLVRYPDRIRIVAEGDSWFQFPFLLRDIVDYLSGVYSVFSVAAAGATLGDYLKNSEFLEAIAQVKPDFFLLSGGGNDILGEAFAGFIRETPTHSLTGPQRYLNDTLAPGLEAVGERYKRILRLVQQGYPKVKILVHGYDYVIPVDGTPQDNRASWLGKVLIEKGVTNQGEREAIVRYLLDAFNEQLRQIAGEYPNVTYIDLRGTVRRTDKLSDYWYDEIHPNDKGFLSVATRFVEQINRLKSEPQPVA